MLTLTMGLSALADDPSRSIEQVAEQAKVVWESDATNLALEMLDQEIHTAQGMGFQRAA